MRYRAAIRIRVLVAGLNSGGFRKTLAEAAGTQPSSRVESASFIKTVLEIATVDSKRSITSGIEFREKSPRNIYESG
jgi:hypothetical protein